MADMDISLRPSHKCNVLLCSYHSLVTSTILCWMEHVSYHKVVLVTDGRLSVRATDRKGNHVLSAPVKVFQKAFQAANRDFLL